MEEKTCPLLYAVCVAADLWNRINYACIGDNCMLYWKCKRPKTVAEVREEIFGGEK